MKALGLTLLLYDLVLQRSAHAVNSSTNTITAAGTNRTALHTVHVNTVWDIYERTRFKTGIRIPSESFKLIEVYIVKLQLMTVHHRNYLIKV